MKKALALFLGLLTAIGGFVDIGDIVTAGVVGSRFGLSLAWVLVVGTFSICVFAEMSGRVAAVSGRPTFDLIRERLGPRVGLLNLVGSIAVTLLTFIAEIGGVALALQLATSVNPYLWIPVVAAALWLVFWRVKFSALEDTFGLGGLALVVFAVAVWQLSPDWSQMWHEASTATMPQPEGIPTYWYYAVAIFGATMTPYEVFFFSSGGVEEGWTRKDIPTMRANVFLGFPLGAVLSVAITASAAIVFLPLSIEVGELSQTVLPVGMALGKIGIAIALLGLFAATFGAACETGLSVATASASTSAGSGASTPSRCTPPGSTRSCSCCASSARACCSRPSTRSWSRSTRSSSAPSPCRSRTSPSSSSPTTARTWATGSTGGWPTCAAPPCSSPCSSRPRPPCR